MIEAVIILPVLGLLFVASLFVRDVYLARQQVRLEARRCAWAHAIAGCGALPEGCEGSPLHDPRGDDDAAMIIRTARARAGTDAEGFDVFDDVPLIGTAIEELFGSQPRATAQRALPLPWKPNTGLRADAELVVTCNAQPRDALQTAKKVFCTHVPSVPCDGE